MHAQLLVVSCVLLILTGCIQPNRSDQESRHQTPSDAPSNGKAEFVPQFLFSDASIAPGISEQDLMAMQRAAAHVLDAKWRRLVQTWELIQNDKTMREMAESRNLSLHKEWDQTVRVTSIGRDNSKDPTLYTLRTNYGYWFYQFRRRDDGRFSYAGDGPASN